MSLFRWRHLTPSFLEAPDLATQRRADALSTKNTLKHSHANRKQGRMGPVSPLQQQYLILLRSHYRNQHDPRLVSATIGGGGRGAERERLIGRKQTHTYGHPPKRVTRKHTHARLTV